MWFKANTPNGEATNDILQVLLNTHPGEIIAMDGPPKSGKHRMIELLVMDDGTRRIDVVEHDGQDTIYSSTDDIDLGVEPDVYVLSNLDKWEDIRADQPALLQWIESMLSDEKTIIITGEQLYERLPELISGIQTQHPLHTDACIWSPDVVICKSDSGIPQRMGPEDWVTVDVITCAAPNLREQIGNIHNPEMAQPVHLSWAEQYALHLQRARHILHIAAANRVSTLILGAFGCGAFANDPGAVAAAYKEALEDYGQYFKYVEFAVYCRDHEQENYIAFRNVFVL